MESSGLLRLLCAFLILGRRVRAMHDDPDILIISEEIDSWMGQPNQNLTNVPPHLQEVFYSINTSDEKTTSANPDRVFVNSNTYCGACRILAKIVIGYIRLGGPMTIMANFLVKVCFLVGYQSVEVCRGLIHPDRDILEFIIKTSDVTSENVCALLLGSHGCGIFYGPYWAVYLPPPDSSGKTYSLPRSVRSQFRSHTNARSISSHSLQLQTLGESDIRETKPISFDPMGKKVLKMLHLTDPHYDPFYRIGSNAVCEAPLCCNADSGVPKSPADRAGKWGDYRSCDSPRWLLQHMLHNIVITHPDIDYILCTGDLVPHHIWKIKREENVAVMKDVSKILRQYFPDIPVYGAVGNHESSPRDSFPPPELPEVWSRFGNQWLYDSLAEEWSELMGQPIFPSARFGGYYSVRARPGFRIISINTNFCYRLNWWVLKKSVDPGLLLQWLVNELQMAEQNGELVHIIGHVPPFYIDCYSHWGHQFSRVVTRFAHIIRGQFYGHSHLDEFRINYDVKEPEKPISVQYITPNNGPFHDLNPSYRIYYVDGDYPGTTRNVLDYETWVMNLTHANLYDAPHWYLLYGARKDLNLPSLSPKHWDHMVQRLSREPQFFERYYRYQVQDSDAAMRRGCNNECKTTTICSIVDADLHMPKKCRPFT